MTKEEIMSKANAEIERLGGRILVELSLCPVSTMQVIAICQLVLRHPGLPMSSREFAKTLIDKLSKGVPADCIGMKTLMELGWDKTMDS